MAVVLRSRGILVACRGASFLAVTLLVASCVNVGSDDTAADALVVEQPIVGTPENLESGYAGVGAMVVDFGVNWGHFCTGSLIDDEWVLTAAHCLDDLDPDTEDLEPWQVSFFVGSDARDPDNGDAYEADGFFIHPDWDGDEHDVALVHLSDSADTVARYALNSTDLSDVPSGQRQLTWVGFGHNNGSAQTGGGRKRRGSGSINTLFFFEYEYLDGQGYLPCQGDSGGPAFMTIDGDVVIVGTMTAVGEDCEVFGVDTRVDAHINFIEGTMGDGFTQCDLFGGDCPSGQTCYQIEDTNQCIPSDDIAAGSSCNSDPETWLGSLPCADGALCLNVDRDDESIGECFAYCNDANPCGAGRECLTDVFTDDPDLGICIQENVPCEITGGDCGSGACYPTSEDETSCFSSDGIELGEACNSDDATWDRLPCGDGLICLQVSATITDGECFGFCENDGQCGSGNECNSPLFTGIDDLGYCDCIDADNDGWCQVDDCRDDNRFINPDRREVCGDGIDNDCANGPDDGCVVCTDVDGDSYCDDVDCRDDLEAVNPGATEICDDGLDNDCANGVDDGCDDCTDDDDDGYCDDVDCDDGNGAIHPDATELCDDDVDQNCVGGPNDGCANCIDIDNDDYCDDVDCDDDVFSTNPGAAERCGDDIDNNCNDQTDEGCDACEDLDLDGYCGDSDCDDDNPVVNPGVRERCGDGIDNDCRAGIDDGCGACTDNDEDGWCDVDDCADDDPLVNPDADEVCDDNRDHNCDGMTRDGCPECIDEDDDGSCLPEDCDDDDPTAHPLADEICGDLIDNNCEGHADEDCPDEIPAVVDADGDGWDNTRDCDDNNPLASPTNYELCEDGADNDCDGLTDDDDPDCQDDDSSELDNATPLLPDEGCSVAGSRAPQLPVLGLLLVGLAARMRRRH